MARTVPLLREPNGNFASPYNAEKRAAVRADYETTDLTLRDITTKHGISGSTFQVWARAGCWEMRQPHRIDADDLISRTIQLIDRQIAEMETAMTNGATEVAVLAKLVSTLDRVLALKDRTAKKQTTPSRRVQTLRGKIADRLVELNRD